MIRNSHLDALAAGGALAPWRRVAETDAVPVAQPVEMPAGVAVTGAVAGPVAGQVAGRAPARAPAPRARFSAPRNRKWLFALPLVLPILFVGSREVLGRSGFATPYSVSVDVNLTPDDPQLWALANAANFDAARAIDADLPDPLAVPALGDAPVGTAPVDVASLRQSAYVGPAAQRVVFRGRTAADTARAHYCLTAALYYEAASESDDGMRGVAQVVLNRVRHPSFPGSVCGVVFQGSNRAIVCQFTFACDGSMARQPVRAVWDRASRIAAEALAGRTMPAVGLATHYHTLAVWPSWGRSLVMTNVIGAHIFHRWRGRWGQPAAFSRPYAGVEPMPGPYLPIAAQLAARAGRANPAITPAMPGAAGVAGNADAATMAAIAAAGRAGIAGAGPTVPAPALGANMAPATAAPSPQYADPRLNQSGTVRDEYRSSGAPVSR